MKMILALFLGFIFNFPVFAQRDATPEGVSTAIVCSPVLVPTSVFFLTVDGVNECSGGGSNNAGDFTRDILENSYVLQHEQLLNEELAYIEAAGHQDLADFKSYPYLGELFREATQKVNLKASIDHEAEKLRITREKAFLKLFLDGYRNKKLSR